MTYAQKLGINTFVPRFLPSILTFILGPILGAASDRSLSKWGRRNVFLIMACMIVTVSGICYGGALKFFPEQPALVNFFFTSLLIGCLLFDVSINYVNKMACNLLSTCLACTVFRLVYVLVLWILCLWNIKFMHKLPFLFGQVLEMLEDCSLFIIPLLLLFLLLSMQQVS
jgi:hypothetical protein